MTMVSNDLQETLIIRLSDEDFLHRNVSTQIETKLSFVVETAQIKRLLINLADVTFLSSQAIGQLIMLKKKCDQHMIALAMFGVRPKIMNVLQVVRCEQIIDIYESQREAIHAFRESFMLTPEAQLSTARIEELRASAETNNVESIYELARRKIDGRGLEQDAVGSVVLFQKAAELGHCDAQFDLATCYAFGLGVPQDYAKAIPWYERAAQQGHPEAQYMLAMSFHYALNDVIDMELARTWYERAAAQGHEKSNHVLEELGS